MEDHRVNQFLGIVLNDSFDNDAHIDALRMGLAREKKCVLNYSTNGFVKDEEAFDRLLSEMSRCIYVTRTDQTTNSELWEIDHDEGFSLVRIDRNDGAEGRIWCHVVSGNKDWFDPFCLAVYDTLEQREPSNNLMVLCRQHDSLCLRPVGQIEIDFERKNYADKFVFDYEHTLECLSSDEPCGRLVIMDGPPGTGKSFAIRSIISKVNATFIAVSPSLIGALSGPEILPILANQARVEDDLDKARPIVLILEDADNVLVDRHEADTVGLAEVLNLGDGLLGQLLDVRILATTNADKLQLDKAITRPGRMCRHLHSNFLNAKHADELLHSLVPGHETRIREDISLAEVYRLARNDGWRPDPKERKGVAGF